jgi:hypothetical protein
MGKVKSAAVLERAATVAKARELHYKNKVASTTTTVRKREMDKYVYASQALKTGTNSQLFQVLVSKPSLIFFGNGGEAAAGATALGLRAITAGSDPVSSKPKGFTPAMVHAMKGTSTPVARVTEWKTRVIKYSTTTDGTAQAHFSAPISGSAALVTYDNINDKSNTIFNAIKASQLGDLDYARFWLTPEQFSNIKN